MAPDEPTADLKYYEADTEGKQCSVNADASLLQCTIHNLAGGQKYRVAGRVCMPTYQCSSKNVVQGYTLPDGKFPAQFHPSYYHHITLPFRAT